jgi:hypothetical protein
MTQRELEVIKVTGMDYRSYSVFRLSHLIIPGDNIFVTKDNCHLSDEQYTEFMLKLKSAVEGDHYKILELVYGLRAEYDYLPRFYQEIHEILLKEGYETLCGHVNNIETIRFAEKEAERMVKFSRELRAFNFPWSSYNSKVVYARKQLKNITDQIVELQERKKAIEKSLKVLDTPIGVRSRLLEKIDLKQIRSKVKVDKEAVSIDELCFSRPVTLALEHNEIYNLEQLENLGIQKICSIKNFSDEYCLEIVERLEQLGIRI